LWRQKGAEEHTSPIDGDGDDGLAAGILNVWIIHLLLLVQVQSCMSGVKSEGRAQQGTRREGEESGFHGKDASGEQATGTFFLNVSSRSSGIDAGRRVERDWEMAVVFNTTLIKE
jgi:hypothetical protein